MKKNLAIVLVLATAAVAAQAFAGRSVDVGIKEFKFTPAALEVPRGTTVKWVNHDEETHTITSTTGAFGSSGLGNDESFTQTFTRPGSYEYFCALHPKMRATVIVK